jgi:predicted nuclease with TOPRIM domain
MDLGQEEDLKQKYDELNKEYELLKSKYTNLENEFNENTIIQSMNDMKRKYEELMESTVSSYKYNMINKKYKKLYKIVVCASVLLEHNISLLKRIVEGYNNSNSLYKVQTNLITLKTLIDECDE